VAAARRRIDTRRLPPGWQIYLFIGLYPLLWLLGLAYFVWPLIALGFALSLCLKRGVRVPPGFGLWVLFLLWMLASAVEIPPGQRYLLFTWRALIYLTAGGIFLWVYNRSEDDLPNDAVAGALTMFWGVIVLGGAVGVVLPRLSWHSFAQDILPHSVMSNGMVYAYTHPALAQMMFAGFGHPVGRPTAFFGYTNQWAAAVGVLTPFALLTAFRSPRPRIRMTVWGLLALSALPIVVSLNRGLWIALALAGVYAAGKLAFAGRGKVLLGGLIALLAMGAVISLTPLGNTFNTRASMGQAGDGVRATVYQEALSGVASSPLYGYGAPRASTSTTTVTGGTHVGTQGQFWLVLFSHGIPGMVFYLGFFGFTFLHALRRRSVEELAWNAVLVISFVEMMVYDFMPTTLYVVMIGCALLWRRRMAPVRAVSSARRPVRPPVLPAPGTAWVSPVRPQEQ
jgi:hypothetical protein